MDLKGENIFLSTDRTKNFIKYGNRDLKLMELTSSLYGNKGGNSYVFLLRDPNETYEDRVIKICKSPIESKKSQDVKRLNRFTREIEALKIAKEKNYIIEYFFDSELEIKDKKFRYYVMEKGEIDLKQYILTTELSIQEKILFCKQIIQSLNELHELDIYHRDIKPDNIFFIDKKFWKIGDLGLINFRHEDETLDRPNEMIGPRGWLSPEAMNKFLTFQINTEFKFDCMIDDKSDVFQLGKLFWFIFQCNVPIGQLKREDFYFDDKDVFDLLFSMLYHSKERRIDLTAVKEKFKPLESRYVV